MAFFGTFLYGEELFGTESPGPGGSTGPTWPGSSAPLVRVPWIFREVYDGEDIYEFAINPLDATMPSIQKTLTKQITASGKPVIFQGRDAVQTMSFSGTILDQIHLEIMNEWFIKEKQISITDDLGQQYWVYLTNFSPTRNYSSQYPWRHEYSANATVLSW